MATGRSNQLTKQIGEYLVAAELGRFGLIASTFAGSVPDYDIIATDSKFASVPVQVKAITGTSWQFDLRRFISISLEGKKQIVGKALPMPRDIVCVLVVLSRYGSDRFYVLSLTTLQELLRDGHGRYLAKHGGVRPKRHDSFHCAIGERDLGEFRDKWISEFRDKHGLCIDDPGA
jgi:hypothetical protein